MDRQALIERYANGHQAVLDALNGITDAELDARPSPDQWTAREVVHHLAAVELGTDGRQLLDATWRRLHFLHFLRFLFQRCACFLGGAG